MPHFKRSSGWIIILAAASALAQTVASQSPLETCTADDYAIYTAALSELFGKQKIDRIILIDQTSTGFPPGMAAMTQFGGKAQPLLKDFPKEAKDDFDVRNKTHAKIESDQLKAPFEIVLLGADAAGKLVERGGGWKAFRDKYPKAPGITIICASGNRR